MNDKLFKLIDKIEHIYSGIWMEASIQGEVGSWNWVDAEEKKIRGEILSTEFGEKEELLKLLEEAFYDIGEIGDFGADVNNGSSRKLDNHFSGIIAEMRKIIEQAQVKEEQKDIMTKKKLKGYQGIFFDKKTQEQLVRLQENGLNDIIKNMHITFKYGDIEKYPEELLGKEFNLKLVGYASDGKNSGFSVELPEKLKKYYKNSSIPHITVSTGEVDGVKGKAVDTGRLNFKALEEPIEIQGKMGYYIHGKDSKKDKQVTMDNEIINQYERDNMPKNIRIILVPKYMTDEELAEAGISPQATVEAEYGEKVIKGSNVTLAHHTKEYQDNPAPCNTTNVSVLEDGSTIVVSHLDLDTIGGIAALMGRKKENPSFWRAAEFIDLNGPHNLFQVEEGTREKYVAYQAYQTNHRTPRFTEPTDVTDIVLEHLDVIDKIIDGDKDLIQNGIKWDEETKKKIEDCLIFENDNVRVFDSPEGVFCSAAYYSEKQGKVIPSTVARNGKYQSVTVAMADGGKMLSAKNIVQELWGPEAGGHPGIAGSPRGKEMTKKDLQQLAKLVNEKINTIKDREEPIFFEPDKEGQEMDD